MKLNTAEDILSVIRQKGKFQNGCFKKTKHTKFSEKRLFLTPRYAQGVWIVRIRGYELFVFRKIWCAFVYLKHPFWDWSFGLITDDLQAAIHRFALQVSLKTVLYNKNERIQWIWAVWHFSTKTCDQKYSAWISGAPFHTYEVEI